MRNLLKLFILLTLIPHTLLAGERDLYDFLWLDPDKSVFVLQNKLYPKDGSLYFELGYLSNITSDFQDTSGGQLKLGYHFAEEWALELNYITYANSDNTALDSVAAVNEAVPFIRKPISSASVFLIWSPFYGKINTFNQIYYFDWSFGVGTGAYKMESNLETAELTDEDRYDTESYTPIQFKTSLKFHINKNLHLSIDFLNTNYQANTPSKPNSDSWNQNNDLIFNIGASF